MRAAAPRPVRQAPVAAPAPVRVAVEHAPRPAPAKPKKLAAAAATDDWEEF
jgi:hypothetical protein